MKARFLLFLLLTSGCAAAPAPPPIDERVIFRDLGSIAQAPELVND